MALNTANNWIPIHCAALIKKNILSRHPQPESRPTFTDTVALLQRPDFQLLRWSAEDEVAYSEKARTLGGSMVDGNELFTELQEMFSKPASS